ncbi:exodeoxyribonuclease VII large subunit [Halobacillus sp. Marseille-P3879]|uniref:exodeoxyribonuclease VII large subunit n=1 Tax=Halobacillus sp. Marseille-P3879 TaxID=2045014 RepID=UPI000C7B5A43|nr:exodeoxyribonuclease VII large subunit [Halobacillus sp. Marseille-P3879]
MNDRYLTVTALTKYIKKKLSFDPHLKEVWLRGEISNFKHHSRGHMYLSLKDEKSRIQAVMFAGNNRSLAFRPENGMNVLVRGEINVYEPMGSYQLYIQDMQPDGIGALYLAFEQLKEKLQKEGLFNAERKKEIPLYPKHIGVVTSPTGAAIRDILTTLKRRYPIVKVSILPVLVQGRSAASSVSKAIDYANHNLDCDVLIVGRGGGSLEDLWGFNEEEVARAIARSNIPVISAVGHETDTTISDFVADIRAATPSGAAELSVPSLLELKERVDQLRRRLQRAMEVERSAAEKRLHQLTKSYAFKYPEQLMKQKEQELDRLIERMSSNLKSVSRQQNERLTFLRSRLKQQHPQAEVEAKQKQLQEVTKQLQTQFQYSLGTKKDQFRSTLEKLTLLNPLDTMKRGYAIPYTNKGHVIKSVDQVTRGDEITVDVKNGTLWCEITGVKEEEN